MGGESYCESFDIMEFYGEFYGLLVWLPRSVEACEAVLDPADDC